MTFKILVLFLFGLGFSSSFAAETCISSPKELAANKAAFPRFLQADPPMLFIRDSLPVAAIKIALEGDKIVGDSVHKVLFGSKRDRGYVKRLCYDGRTLKVDLEILGEEGKENKSVDVKILNDSTISVSGFELKKSSPAQFAAVLNKLVKQEKGPAASAVNTGPATGRK